MMDFTERNLTEMNGTITGVKASIIRLAIGEFDRLDELGEFFSLRYVLPLICLLNYTKI